MIAISVPFLLSHNQVQDGTRCLHWSDYAFELEVALSPFILHTVEGRRGFSSPHIYIYICVWLFTTVHRLKDSNSFLKATHGSQELKCFLTFSVYKVARCLITPSLEPWKRRAVSTLSIHNPVIQLDKWGAGDTQQLSDLPRVTRLGSPAAWLRDSARPCRFWWAHHFPAVFRVFVFFRFGVGGEW